MVVGLIRRRQHGHDTRLRTPAHSGFNKINMGDAGLELRQLGCQSAAGVQHERGAVKHLIVLPADHVQIDQRQPGFHHARHHQIGAHGRFAAVIGRSVRHQQYLCARFRQRFTHFGMPSVFADRAADAQRANAVGALRRRGREDALFVKHPVIGQIVFQNGCGDLALLQDVIGIIQLAVAQMRPADAHCRTIGDLAGQTFDSGHGVAHKGAFQHQILRLIAGDEHLGQCHHLRTRSAPLLPRIQCKCCVRVDGPQRGVQLCQCQAKRVGHGTLRSGLSGF